MEKTWMKPLALGLTAVWACWWTFFVTSSSIGEGGGWTQVMAPIMIGAAIFLGSAFAAWRWDASGATLLIAEGVIVIAAFPAGFLHPNSSGTMIFVLLTLAAPPIVSGLLLLAGRGRRMAGLRHS